MRHLHIVLCAAVLLAFSVHGQGGEDDGDDGTKNPTGPTDPPKDNVLSGGSDPTRDGESPNKTSAQADEQRKKEDDSAKASTATGVGSPPSSTEDILHPDDVNRHEDYDTMGFTEHDHSVESPKLDEPTLEKPKDAVTTSLDDIPVVPPAEKPKPSIVKDSVTTPLDDIPIVPAHETTEPKVPAPEKTEPIAIPPPLHDFPAGDVKVEDDIKPLFKAHHTTNTEQKLARLHAVAKKEHETPNITPEDKKQLHTTLKQQKLPALTGEDHANAHRLQRAQRIVEGHGGYWPKKPHTDEWLLSSDNIKHKFHAADILKLAEEFVKAAMAAALSSPKQMKEEDYRKHFEMFGLLRETLEHHHDDFVPPLDVKRIPRFTMKIVMAKMRHLFQIHKVSPSDAQAMENIDMKTYHQLAGKLNKKRAALKRRVEAGTGNKFHPKATYKQIATAAEKLNQGVTDKGHTGTLKEALKKHLAGQSAHEEVGQMRKSGALTEVDAHMTALHNSHGKGGANHPSNGAAGASNTTNKPT